MQLSLYMKSYRKKEEIFNRKTNQKNKAMSMIDKSGPVQWSMKAVQVEVNSKSTLLTQFSQLETRVGRMGQRHQTMAH